MIIFQEPFLQKPVASILVVVISFLLVAPVLLSPRQADAIVVTVAADVVEVIQTALQAVWQGAKAVWQAADLGEFVKQTATLLWEKGKKIAEWTKGVLLNLLLHRILAEITNDIVNWIQNGGELRFMSEGLGSFLSGAADDVLGNFIANYLGADFLCEPFKASLEIALMPVPHFETRAECTLSDMGDNLKGFYNDFSQGGWSEWIKLTQPKNNFYGVFLAAKEERDKQVLEAKQEMEADALMGDGFLSQKNCIWRDANGRVVERQEDVRGYPSLPEDCQDGSAELPCRPDCRVVNPGKTISEAANKAVTNFYDQINAQIAGATAKAGPYQIYVQAIANALINRVVQEGFALFQDDGSYADAGYSGSVPNYGDKGESSTIPQTKNPESVVQSRESAEGIRGQINLIKQNLETDLLNEQNNNLSVLKSVLSVYQNEVLPVLEEIIQSCPNTSYANWANSQKNQLNNDLIPSLNQRISQLESDSDPETLDIVSVEGTIATANYIDSSVIPAINNYRTKAEDWLEVYEEAEGREESAELDAAEEAVNQAEAEAISEIQKIIKAVNGSFTSNDFSGLEQEAQTANIALTRLAYNLLEERGNSSFPGAGTLYAELESAQALKNEANSKLSQCLLELSEDANNED